MFINWSKYSTKHVFEKKKSMQSIKARKYDKYFCISKLMYATELCVMHSLNVFTIIF